MTLGWANEGLSYWAYVPATIKVGCYFFLSDVHSFNSPPSCVVCLHRLDCDCFPVYLLLCLPCMYSIPLFVSLLSLGLFSNILPVSPIYMHVHSAQGIWYTTPLFFHTGCGSFVCTRASQASEASVRGLNRRVGHWGLG